MIAIPVEYNAKDEMVPSKLFGNAKYFALYTPQYRFSSILTNTQSGNGISTAEHLLKNGVTKALYSYLGDGPFNTLINNGSDIFYMGKDPLSLNDVIADLQTKSLLQVTLENAKEYLDPGTTAGSCECGCSHE